MKNFLKPPEFKSLLSSDKIDEVYKSQRLRVFIGIFIGYASYYLVRKNFALAMPYLEDLGFSKSDLGFAFAFNAIAYAFSKFLMAGISDRSNARRFLPLGLILASTLIIIAGTSLGHYNIVCMAVMQFLIGWCGGMGWPPCGRVMTHWFSIKERGTKMAIWNVAHNVGGGLVGTLAAFGTTYAASLGISKVLSWEIGVFFLPATIAILIAFISYVLIRDTPQSCGLPSIEKYRNDYPINYSEDSEKVLSTKEIFFKYVLNNKVLWYVAVANAFVYFVRYGISDWAPTYLHEVVGFTKAEAGYAYSFFEWAAIPGTLLCGWVSDKWFKGKRSLPTALFMILVAICVFIYWQNTESKFIAVASLISIGFFIYGPVMLIGVQALDLSPKNAAGTSAGLTGFFGYFFGTAILGNFLFGEIASNFGWNAGYELILASCFIAIILMLMTNKAEMKRAVRIANENRK